MLLYFSGHAFIYIEKCLFPIDTFKKEGILIYSPTGHTPLMKEIENLSVLFNIDKTVMIDFWAEWCGPCRSYKGVLATVDPKWEIYTCNVDTNPTIANQFRITALPTSIFFRDGKELERVVGLMSKDKIEKTFQKYEPTN